MTKYFVFFTRPENREERLQEVRFVVCNPIEEYLPVMLVHSSQMISPQSTVKTMLEFLFCARVV